MATLLQTLQQELLEAERQLGPGAWSVKQLRTQIQGMERQVRQDYKREQAIFEASMGQPSATAPKPMRPAADAVGSCLKDNKGLLDSGKPTV